MTDNTYTQETGADLSFDESAFRVTITSEGQTYMNLGAHVLDIEYKPVEEDEEDEESDDDKDSEEEDLGFDPEDSDDQGGEQEISMDPQQGELYMRIKVTASTVGDLHLLAGKYVEVAVAYCEGPKPVIVFHYTGVVLPVMETTPLLVSRDSKAKLTVDCIMLVATVSEWMVAP